MDLNRVLLAEQHSIQDPINQDSKKDLLAEKKSIQTHDQKSPPGFKKALLAERYSVWPQEYSNPEIRKSMLSEKHSVLSLDYHHPRRALLAERHSILSQDYRANPDVKKTLLAEKHSIISIDQQLRTRGGMDSFALKRMMSTESTSGNDSHDLNS